MLLPRPITSIALLLALVMATGVSGCVDARTARLSDRRQLDARTARIEPSTDATATANEQPAQFPGPRLLVIGPHPDDETLATGGAISGARRHGWDVKVIVVTCGDGYIGAARNYYRSQPTPAQMLAYGTMRAQECRRATALLGVPAKDLTFLGFPDGSTNRLLDSYYNTHAIRGANGATRVPYAFAYRPGAPYSGSELLGQLERLIRADRPTTVLYPDPSDGHVDHWGVGVFTQIALAQTGYRGSQASYLVHRKGFPRPLGLHPNATLDPPPSLERAGDTWLTLPLDPVSQNTKRKAFSEYRSQIAADALIVGSFLRTNELFMRSPVSVLSEEQLALPEPVFPSVGWMTSAQVNELHLQRRLSTLVLGFRTVGPTSPHVDYTLHVGTFDPRGGVRYADVSSPTSATPLMIRANGTDFAIPNVLSRGVRWLVVGVDWRAGQHSAGHAPWRLVRLAP